MEAVLPGGLGCSVTVSDFSTASVWSATQGMWAADVWEGMRAAFQGGRPPLEVCTTALAGRELYGNVEVREGVAEVEFAEFFADLDGLIETYELPDNARTRRYLRAWANHHAGVGESGEVFGAMVTGCVEAISFPGLMQKVRLLERAMVQEAKANTEGLDRLAAALLMPRLTGVGVLSRDEYRRLVEGT